MSKLVDGRVVEGDVLEMAEPYHIQSSAEAWIICEMAKEIRRLRAGLLKTAADCHRVKWAYEHDESDAFQALTKIGHDAKKLRGVE